MHVLQSFVYSWQVDAIYRECCTAMVEPGGRGREVLVFDPDEQTADQLEEAARQFLTNPRASYFFHCFITHLWNIVKKEGEGVSHGNAGIPLKKNYSEI